MATTTVCWHALRGTSLNRDGVYLDEVVPTSLQVLKELSQHTVRVSTIVRKMREPEHSPLGIIQIIQFSCRNIELAPGSSQDASNHRTLVLQGLCTRKPQLYLKQTDSHRD